MVGFSLIRRWREIAALVFRLEPHGRLALSLPLEEVRKELPIRVAALAGGWATPPLPYFR